MEGLCFFPCRTLHVVVACRTKIALVRRFSPLCRSLLQQVADGNYSGGNYLVNGTGFVYNDTALTVSPFSIKGLSSVTTLLSCYNTAL